MQVFDQSEEYARIYSGLVLLFMIGWMVVYRIAPRVYNTLWFRIYAWAGSISFGLWALFMLFILPWDVFLLVLQPFCSQDLSYLAAAGSRTLFIFSMIGVVIGLIQTLSGPKLKEVRIKFPNLPKGLQGLRISQISDIHIGATIRRRYVEKIVRIVNAASPDLIAITGDLADGSVVLLAAELAPLINLHAKHGVFFATGNHDYYSGVLSWLKKLKEFGFYTLLNENKILDISGSKLMIAGVTDPTGWLFEADHRVDLEQAIASTVDCDLKILLAHQPNVCRQAAKAGFDLQLSGHTHSGQFFPFSLLVRLAHVYSKGLNKLDNLWVYVNPATGYWGPPLRFLVPAEVTLIVLENA